VQLVGGTRFELVTPAVVDYADSKTFPQHAMNNAQLPIGLRMDAAKALLPYEHARMGEKGKK
jgi:hypothetical protein